MSEEDLMKHADKAGFTLIKKEEAALLEKVLASVHTVGQSILSADENNNNDDYDDGQETVHWFRSPVAAPSHKKWEPAKTGSMPPPRNPERADSMSNFNSVSIRAEPGVPVPVQSTIREQSPVVPTSRNPTPSVRIEERRAPPVRQQLVSPPEVVPTREPTPPAVQPQTYSVSVVAPPAEAEVVEVASTPPEEPKATESVSRTPTPPQPTPQEAPIVVTPPPAEVPNPAPPVPRPAPKANVAPQTPKKSVTPQASAKSLAPQPPKMDAKPQTPNTDAASQASTSLAPQKVKPQTPKVDAKKPQTPKIDLKPQTADSQIKEAVQEADDSGRESDDDYDYQDMRSENVTPEAEHKEQEVYVNLSVHVEKRVESPAQILKIPEDEDVPRRDTHVKETEDTVVVAPVTESRDDHVVQNAVVTEPPTVEHNAAAASIDVPPDAGSAKKVLGLWMKKLERRSSIVEPPKGPNAPKPVEKSQAMGTRLTAALNLLQIAQKLPRGTTGKSRQETTTQTDDDDGVAAEGLRQLKSLLGCVYEFRREVIDEMFSVEEDADSETDRKKHNVDLKRKD
jgi:hypothetical protein